MRKWAWLLALVIGCSDCNDEETAETEETVETETPEAPVEEPIQALPAVQTNMDKVVLGRRLYFDPILSGDGTISCATCHSLDHGGAEPRAVSTGINSQSGPINSPTVLNAGFNFRQFWDGRAADLREQAEGPVENPLEMGTTFAEAIERIRGDEWYVERFGALYGGEITKENITDAIAEYERSLVTPSPVDAFLNGDESALNEQQQRGYATFKEVGCASCHMGVNVGGTMYQKMGVVEDYFALRGGELTEADQGRFAQTQSDSDRHFFKVPTLRNVALTPPYFHDGSQEELGEAVRIMARVQLGRRLEDAQIADIVAFLEALTGELPEHARIPEDEMPPDRSEGATQGE